MKRYFVLLLLVLLFGCKQDDNIDNLSVDNFCVYCDPEWRANPIAIIDDGKVHLKWAKPHPLCEELIRPFELTFDIYISENEMSNFRKHINLNGSYSYTVDKLQNNKPYFFHIISKKDGFKPINSDTIMVIPNKRKEYETLLTSDVSPFLWVSMAHQNNKIAYFNVNFSLNGGSDLLISNMDGSKKELLLKTNAISGSPRWSPSNDKMVFYTAYPAQRGIVSYSIPVIELYDFKTESITQLTTENESSVSPVFSENGELLLFLSTKPQDVYEGTRAHFWLKNLITDELFQITDFSQTSLLCDEPCWIDNDRFLFHGRYFHEVFPIENYQLFESSISKKQITKVFESRWNDYTPSISPDKKKIAFISDRSGSNQVWIYQVDRKTYTQITPYSNDESVNPYYSNIEWLDDSTMVFTINGNQLVRQRVE